VQTPTDGALRRGVLAASVLHDVPLEPQDGGVLVGASWEHRARWQPVSWALLAQAVDGADPESLTGRVRLRDWLRARAALDDRPRSVRGRTTPLALPVGHALHPGASWVRERVLGGVLDVGIGLRDEDDVVVPLAESAARAAGVDTTAWWERAAEQRDAMALLAVERLRRDGRGVLRPIGGADVLTLLSGRALREHLATEDGTGMRALAAPMRSRGWFDLARIDPAFVGAAAQATDPEQRGVERPLLVTVDEVALSATGVSSSQLAAQGLADPAAPVPLHERDVLYR
jgi:hypothetical protein